MVNLFQFRKHWGSKRYRDYSKKVVTKIPELSWIIPWRQSNKLVKFFSKMYFTLIHSREIDFLGKRWQYWEKKSVKQAIRGAFCCQNCQIAFSAFDGIFQPEKHTGGAECLWEASSVFTWQNELFWSLTIEGKRRLQRAE